MVERRKEDAGASLSTAIHRWIAELQDGGYVRFRLLCRKLDVNMFDKDAVDMFNVFYILLDPFPYIN